MNQRDIVYLRVDGMPSVGEVVGITPKRIRIAIREHTGYFTVLRAKHNIQLAKKAKRLV